MSAPPDKKSQFHFSNRARNHKRLVQVWSNNNTTPCVWYANDHVLATSQRALQAVQRAILTNKYNKGAAAYTVKLETTMFTGSGLKVGQALKARDVHVARIIPKHGKPVPNNYVANLVLGLRANELKGHEREVSPNHILVPEWNGDACPYGAPTEYNGPIPPPLPTAAQQPGSGSYRPEITLLDSGYYWDTNWGQNPLAGLLGISQVDPTPAEWPNDSNGWSTCPPEALDANNPTAPTRIDALAGHANFVAGVLAQRSNGPTINIWDHNAGFIADDLSHVPTELAVLRSLLKSQAAGMMTPLIVLTFAFAPLGDVLSDAWDTAFQQLMISNKNFVIVAPAGNQGTTQRRYPAALAVPDPRLKIAGRTSQASGSYPQHVIGVGALDATGTTAASWSNRGGTGTISGVTAPDPWVVCAAIGEKVPSTFLHANLPPEDSSTAPHNFAGTNWATWQGTCFAAPKIAAMIAKYMTSATDRPWDAWGRAKNALIPPTSLGVGLNFGMLG